MVVPERLRAKVGKREIKISLGTSDPSEAKIRQAQEQARWRARFRDLDRDIEDEAAARAPEIVDDFLEAMARRNGAMANVIFGLQSVIAMRLFIGWGRGEFKDRRADRAFAFMPGRNAWRGADFSPIADIIPSEDRDRLLARIDLLHRHKDTQGAGFAEAIGYLLRAQAWDVVRIEVMIIEDHARIAIVRGSALFNAIAEHLLRRLAARRAESEELLQHIGEAETSLARAAPVFPPAAATKTSKTSRKGAKPLSTGLAHWIELRKPRPQSEVEARRAVKRFIELNGDIAVEQITRDHILEYRDFISRMPRNLNLEKLKRQGVPLRKAVGAALKEKTVEPLRTLSPGAVKKDVGVFAAILGVLRNEGWIDDNVATGITIAGYSKTRKGQRIPRLPLRRSMMETLFASPLFTGCEGRSDIERTRPGANVYQDALYWTFLFGATAGPRLEEIGQIRLDDIEIIPRDEGHPTVAIYVTGTGLGESIKNDESARVIVVHARLLDLGFLEYVEERGAARAERLFDLKQSATGKWTKELSRRVNRYVDRVVTTDPRYVFHSMRHEFKDRAEETISTRVHDRITGHSPATVAGRYGLGASIDLIAREIEKLDLGFIDWRRLREAANRQASRKSSAVTERPLRR